MDKKIQQGMTWLNKEIKKDEVDILQNKKKIIDEIKQLKKENLFVKPQQKKISILEKFLLIIGYGKKG